MSLVIGGGGAGVQSALHVHEQYRPGPGKHTHAHTRTLAHARTHARALYLDPSSRALSHTARGWCWRRGVAACGPPDRRIRCDGVSHTRQAHGGVDLGGFLPWFVLRRRFRVRPWSSGGRLPDWRANPVRAVAAATAAAAVTEAGCSQPGSAVSPYLRPPPPQRRPQGHYIQVEILQDDPGRLL